MAAAQLDTCPWPGLVFSRTRGQARGTASEPDYMSATDLEGPAGKPKVRGARRLARAGYSDLDQCLADLRT
jgi:hypothetical protein